MCQVFDRSYCMVVGLDHAKKTDLWDVRARTKGAFDASAPLENRSVHYWPCPFGAAKSVAEALIAEATAAGQAAAKSARDQSQRLLYVTLTRAGEQVVLISEAATGGDPPPLDWLVEAGASATFWQGPLSVLLMALPSTASLLIRSGTNPS